MNEKDFFTPENIQQLVDQLSQLATEHAPDHHNEQLIVALQHIYDREDEHESVERVRQRLASRHAAFAPARDTQDHHSYTSDLLYFDIERPLVTEKTVRRPVTIPRVLGIIAAVLVISFIVGNWFVVTRIMLHRTSASSMGPSKTTDNVYIAGKQIIYKLSGYSGTIVWQQKLSTVGAISIKTLDGMTYAMQYHDIYAINPLDGTIRWHKHSTTDTYVTMIAQDGTLYLSGNYQPDKRHISTLFLALNARDGSKRWGTAVINTGYSQWFEVQHGTIYVRTDRKDGLYAIDATTGKLRWQSHEKFDAPGLDELPLVDNGVVYDFYGNHLYALDEKTGGQLWHQQISADRSFYSARLDNGVFYIGSSLFRQQYNNQYEFQERVQAFSDRAGAKLWTFTYRLQIAKQGPRNRWPDLHRTQLPGHSYHQRTRCQQRQSTLAIHR